jgi:hypothetical protein
MMLYWLQQAHVVWWHKTTWTVRCTAPFVCAFVSTLQSTDYAPLKQMFLPTISQAVTVHNTDNDIRNSFIICRLTSHEIPRYPNVHYYVYNSPKDVPIQSKINPFHILTPYFIEINFSITILVYIYIPTVSPSVKNLRLKFCTQFSSSQECIMPRQYHLIDMTTVVTPYKVYKL